MSVKRILSSFMAFIMLMLIVPQAALAEEYVSLKDLANANGYEYFWYEDSETVNVRSASYILSFQNGNNMMGYKTVLSDEGAIKLDRNVKREDDTLYISEFDVQSKLVKYFPNGLKGNTLNLSENEVSQQELGTNDQTDDETSNATNYDNVLGSIYSDDLSGEVMLSKDKILSSEYNNTAVILDDGSLWIWGGFFGNGITGIKKSAVKVMENIKSVSTGNGHVAALKTDGSLWTWGWNYHGQLGDGTTDDKAEPVKIMDNVVAVSAKDRHTAAIKTDGSLWMWGYNERGQLGDGTTENKNTPVKIMDNVAAVSVGQVYTTAIKTDGSLWAWGYNYNGQLGDGTTKSEMKPIKIMDEVAVVSAGHFHTAAIKTDGSLWMWGCNDNGQLGDGTNKDSYSPVKIMDNVAAVSAGYYCTAAIRTDGSLWTWGCNSEGQLGDGTTENRYSPMKIMDEVAAVSVYRNTVVMKTDKSLWTFGNNDHGQLGDGTTENRYSPTKIMSDGRWLNGDAAVVPTITEQPQDQSNPSVWATGEVNAAVNAGIIPEELLCDYQTPITRGEFCMLAEKLMQVYAPDYEGYIILEQLGTLDSYEFSDTSEEYIRNMALLGVVSGYEDGTFKPEKSISRQEAAVMIKRAADVLGDMMGYPVSNIIGFHFYGAGLGPKEEGEFWDVRDLFEDGADIGEWAVSGVKYVTENVSFSNDMPIMAGVEGNRFAPLNEYTREQAIASFSRLSSIIILSLNDMIYEDERKAWSEEKYREEQDKSVMRAIESLDKSINDYAETLKKSVEDIGKGDYEAVANLYMISSIDKPLEVNLGKYEQDIYKTMYEYTKKISDNTSDISDVNSDRFDRWLKDIFGNMLTEGFSKKYGNVEVTVFPGGRYGISSMGVIDVTSGGNTYKYMFNSTPESTKEALTEFIKQSSAAADKLGEEAIEAARSEVINAVTDMLPVDFLGTQITKKVNKTLQELGLGDVSNLLGDLNDMYSMLKNLKNLKNSELMESRTNVVNFLNSYNKVMDDIVTDDINDAAVKAAVKTMLDKFKQLNTIILNEVVAKS